MRRYTVQLLVFAAAVVAVGGGWLLFLKTESGRYNQTLSVAHSRSEIKLSMSVVHAGGPIAQETWKMQNLDGVSTSEYRALSRGGTQITIDTKPQQTYDVSFFFDKTVSDGIWELRNRPMRDTAGEQYSIEVYQLNNGQHGSHKFTFTDPHYWATTGGHQFHIKLDKNKPTPDLLRMSSTVVVEPRYEKLVNDFSSFGSAGFRAKVASARARLKVRG